MAEKLAEGGRKVKNKDLGPLPSTMRNAINLFMEISSLQKAFVLVALLSMQKATKGTQGLRAGSTLAAEPLCL